MGHLVMSQKERERKLWCELVKRGQITIKKASQHAGISYRQAKRIYRRYCEAGDVGLVHRGRGCHSNRSHPQREMIIHRYRERYEGFGPTLAAEKLAEEALKVDHDTLRVWLLKEGLWHRRRQRSPYRRWREPKAQFGELVQIDGSIHDWFSQGRHDCLLNMVDDATGTCLAQLGAGETTALIFSGLDAWIKKYGIPLSLYVDLKSVYVGSKKNGFSHVMRACEKLGINITKAYSPQAKGRVERKHAVFQDRFVKELQLRNAKTFEAANAILAEGFIDTLNTKFSKVARDERDAHRPLGAIDLEHVFCWDYVRTLQHDWTFSFEGQWYQVEKTTAVRAGQKITVRKHRDTKIGVWCKDIRLDVQVIEKRPKADAVKTVAGVDKSQAGRIGKLKSPWNRYNPGWLSRGADT